MRATEEVVAHYVCLRCPTGRPREGGITTAKQHTLKAHGNVPAAFQLKKLPATVITWSEHE